VPEEFLKLDPREQSRIYRALAPQLSLASGVLEKDVWVCWALETLFTMPGRLPMAFKGGTSLSKVFGAIARFSEDVDITLDYRGLNHDFDPFAPGESRSQLKGFRVALSAFVRQHVHGVAAPWFRERMTTAFRSGGHWRIEIGADGEQLRLHYPSALDTAGNYLGNSVLIELGGRNIAEPNEEHVIRPEIAQQLAGLEFPRAQVTVLSPARTFWEKATLIHVECQRDALRASAARLSRHWYDLAMLADLAIGQAAVADRDLLADVVKHKKVFYHTGYANYDACLNGQLRLIPEASGLSALEEDFRQMIEAGMFIGPPPAFEVVIARLRTLEATINR
jgi:hypothetical protein